LYKYKETTSFTFLIYLFVACYYNPNPTIKKMSLRDEPYFDSPYTDEELAEQRKDEQEYADFQDASRPTEAELEWEKQCESFEKPNEDDDLTGDEIERKDYLREKKSAQLEQAGLVDKELLEELVNNEHTQQHKGYISVYSNPSFPPDVVFVEVSSGKNFCEKQSWNISTEYHKSTYLKITRFETNNEVNRLLFYGLRTKFSHLFIDLPHTNHFFKRGIVNEIDEFLSNRNIRGITQVSVDDK